MVKRKLRMGMVGGGPGSFIGAVHRMAANLDGQIELVCGAFSSDPVKSKQTGASLFLPENRVYDTYAEMISSEQSLPKGERMDFVSIVTPNHLHFAPAKLALQNGFDVVCDKPMAFSVSEAEEISKLVGQHNRLFCLTHNYTGYPMVIQAREMVRQGALGKIRKVIVEYSQGWLATRLEEEGSRQAGWRTDPSRAGIAGCVGDIGTHAENLARFITGLEIEELAADLTSFVPGRQLDDDASILVRFSNGARGVIMASQVLVGEENHLRIAVYGEKGGLRWNQMEPNTLTYLRLNSPPEILRTGQTNLHPNAMEATRLPSGHPEGYLEAFANTYCSFAKAWWQKENGSEPEITFPTHSDGVVGMHFIEAVIDSSQQNSRWAKLNQTR